MLFLEKNASFTTTALLLFILLAKFDGAQAFASLGSGKNLDNVAKINNNAVEFQRKGDEKQKVEVDLLLLNQQLANDFSKLSELRPSNPTMDISAPVDIISDGSSYTRLWTHDTWAKHANPPHVRYLRHVRKWPASKTAQKIVPVVLFSTAWAWFVSWFGRFYAKRVGISSFSSLLQTSGSSAVFSLLAAPLAMLLTLRANASISRLLDARLLWGRLILHARSLASCIKIHVYPYNPQAAVLLARHLAVTGWILKAALRGESATSEQQVIETMLDEQDASWLLAQDKRIIAVTSRLRQICAAALVNINNTIPNSAMGWILEEKISNLEQVVGGCQRVFSSPIPPTYSRHLSRILSMWIFFMPMSFAAAGLSSLGVAVATAISTYVLVGIDEVGMEIERVFLLLPLQQLAAAVQNDVKSEFLPNGGEMPPIR